MSFILDSIPVITHHIIQQHVTETSSSVYFLFKELLTSINNKTISIKERGGMATSAGRLDWNQVILSVH